ncbi:Transcription factor [Acorus gramineus]|uniref:Transcription factor n=1 Tax=Acorus gramineus TaxID=55184 RepID=A0AAV9BRF2_ACOGR|nr:Transcription factor [Acorus gramineus]
MEARDTPAIPTQEDIIIGRPYYAAFNNNNNNNNNTSSFMSGTTLLSSLFPPHHDRELSAAADASKNHREAEKRRRERINSHLQRLRSLLPCNSKTDKASLLAKVVEHVRDLKQRTSDDIAKCTDVLPSETDEISVLHVVGRHHRLNQRSVYKATLCCEDRLDLLPELIKTLKSLRLKTLKAEMSTLGGRARNVLIIAGEEEEEEENSIGFVREALKSVVDRSNGSGYRCKRRRVLDQRSI